jgi:hypothetical protein
MSVETLRPNAAGDETTITYQEPNSTSHYDKVDEAVADEATTMVWTASATYQRDLFNLPAHAGSGAITSIVIYFRCSAEVTNQAWAKPSLKVGITVTDGTERQLSTSWQTFSQQWDTNPGDVLSPDWTWADIDGLQIGVSLKGAGGLAAFCTQVYVEVNYVGVARVGYSALI